jgi:hypothetical protein
MDNLEAWQRFYVVEALCEYVPNTQPCGSHGEAGVELSYSDEKTFYAAIDKAKRAVYQAVRACVDHTGA